MRAVISIGGSLQIFSGNIDVVSMGYRRQSVAILGSEVHVISWEGPAVRIPVPFKAVIGWSAL